MATKQRRVSLAFAGPGQTSLDNAKDLLNDFLGFGPEDEEGFPDIHESDLDLQIYLPATDEHLTDGVATVIDWLDYADLAYDTYVNGKTPSRAIKRVTANAENSEKAHNVNQALVTALKDDQEDGAEAYLILLWGEDGDENAEILLDLASSYGVRALDLTAGLDDLDFGEEPTAPPTQPKPEPEPEPEPEKPRRRRTKTAPAPEPVPAPAAKAQEPDLQDQVASARTKATPAQPEQTPLDRVIEMSEAFISLLDEIGDDSREKSLAKTRAEEAMLWALAHITRNMQQSKVEPEKALEEPRKPATRRRATKAAAPAPEPAKAPEKAAPTRGRGRPRKDGTPAQPRTPEERAVMEIWDEDEQTWVPKGRGRAPKGVPTRLVDPKTGEIVSESNRE